MGIKRVSFKREILLQYSTSYFITIAVIISIIFIPIFFVYNRINFDPAEFVNIYLSTVFTSIMIGIILQAVEMHRVSLNKFNVVRNVLSGMESIVCEIVNLTTKDIDNLKMKVELLKYYRSSLLTMFVSDHKVNEQLIKLYSSDELVYILECFDFEESYVKRKSKEIEIKANILSVKIKDLKDF